MRDIKRKIKSLLLIVAASLVLSGCQATQPDPENDQLDQHVIIDSLGREVILKKQVSRVVAIGPGALRLYLYVDTPDKLVGIEQIEVDSHLGRPYNMANKEILTSVPVIGPGGPNHQPDPEKLLTVQPDVVFSTYSDDKAMVENLQNRTGIPVVSLSYGVTGAFDETILEALQIVGEVMGRQERSQSIAAYINQAKTDLNSRTETVEPTSRPKVYLGALSNRGIHGIQSTTGQYALFEATNVHNVVDETGHRGSLMIDKEQLLVWQPEKVIIDLAGWDLVKRDIQNHPDFYKAIPAFEKGEVYGQLPFNYYHTNIDTALVNAYYIGSVVYPDQFLDIDPKEKADEIYEFLLGKKLYQDMVADFGPLEPIRWEQ